MLARRRTVLSCLLAAGMALAVDAQADARRPLIPDPLDTPSVLSEVASKGTVAGIARQGERLVAVGPRGLILVSSDGATSWKQVLSPVSSDLASVKFVDAGTVWAVGHDAVALRSTDGGASWQKVLDGRSVLALLREAYAARARSGNEGGDEAAKTVSIEIESAMEQSGTKDVFPEPFLDVWFADANEGYLVGAFGLVLRTTDGGKQWQPWIERIDNPRRFHLYAVTGEGAQRYIAGEQGLLLQLDVAQQKFVRIETPYIGTYFGLDVRGERLLAYGLRGNAYVRPRADAPWNKIETGVDANLVAAVNLADNRLLLVSQAGQVLEVAQDLRSAKALSTPVAGEVSGEVFGAAPAGPRRIALARVNGVAALEIAPQSP